MNEQIRSKEVRVIRGESSDSSESTVMNVKDALILADDLGLDLVEVAPNQNPPVCRILDYGKFKFIQNKKDKESRKATRNLSKQKEVRLSPVMSENDILTKIRKVNSFILDGAKVRVFVRFRGRQRAHPEIAMKVLRRVAESTSEIAKLEKAPTMDGRVLSVMLVPDSNKNNNSKNKQINATV
ncbi:MAG: translation initiation factor IF-3 [Dehalococcoidia bacterium]